MDKKLEKVIESLLSRITEFQIKSTVLNDDLFNECEKLRVYILKYEVKNEKD